jgi:hypothetical protein
MHLKYEEVKYSRDEKKIVLISAIILEYSAEIGVGSSS